MNLTYGIHIAPRDDRYITMAEKALAGMSEAAKPGAFLVDLLPICMYYPSCLSMKCQTVKAFIVQ